MTGARESLRLVSERAAQTNAWGDPYETLVPEDEYTVALVREARCIQFRRPTWETTWLIMDSGRYFRLPVYCWWRIPDAGAPVRPSLAFASAYSIATALRPPRDLARRKPFWFAGGCQFLARIRTVDHNSDGVKRPETASYSRLAFLIGRTAGTPPCIRERRG